jgi:putative NADH-flavin reductase
VLTREIISALQPSVFVLYVRSPQKLPEDIATHRDVVVITGQLTDVDGLSKAMEGVDVVISTLGPAVMRGPFHPRNTPLASAYRLLIQLMHKYNVKRIIALGTSSIKDPNDKFSYQFWFLVTGVATLAHTAYKDVVAIGNVIRQDGEDLDWTIVRVPIFTDQETKEFVAGYIGDGQTKAFLSRAAFAAFVISELRESKWTKKSPLLSNP